MKVNLQDYVLEFDQWDAVHGNLWNQNRGISRQ